MAEMVNVSVERLRELEALEAKLPALIDEAIKEYKTSALQRLHEKDKQNPKAVAERAKRYLEKNREALNERRREQRRLKRLEAQTATLAPNPETSATPTKPTQSQGIRIFKRIAGTIISFN